MKLLNYIILVGFMGLIISCGGAAGGNSSYQESGSAVSSQSIQGVDALEIDANGHASLHGEGAEAGDSFVLALYNTASESDASTALSLGDENGTPKMVTHALAGDEPQDFDGQLRELEEDLGDEGRIPSHASMKAAVKALSVGSQREFNVLNNLSGSTYDRVTATLRMATDNLYVYVDNRNGASLSDLEIENAVTPFDAKINQERDFFGFESDVNGDGHISVVLTQTVNSLGINGGGIITGFFYAVDLYSSGRYAISNEQEVLYVSVPDALGQFGTAIPKNFHLTNLLPSVLPHEFQHMINFNQHVLVNNGSTEKPFLNEALSHLAEDIYSMNDSGYMTESGEENIARAALYLNATASTCFTCGTSLAQRGGSYLFVRYLYEQAELGNLSHATNGADLITQLLDTTATGVSNIENAATGSTTGYESLLGSFNLALFLSDTGLTSDNHFNFQGILLRRSQNDSRQTHLDGPSMEDDSDTYLLHSSGMSYIPLMGQDFINSGGTLELQFPQNSRLGGYLIHLSSL